MTRLGIKEIYLAANAALILLEARYRVRRNSIVEMRRWAGSRGKRNCSRKELLMGFRRAASRIDGTCLERALALQRLLSRYGHCSELRIGVGHDADGFGAHAWLVAEDEILEGAGLETERFSVLAGWPTDEFN